MELVHGVHETAPTRGLAPNGGDEWRRDVFHVSFDPETESAVEVVLDAVAVVRDLDQTELDPLHEVVDPDALEALVSPSSAESPTVDEVRFVYEGLEINVDGAGNLWLERE